MTMEAASSVVELISSELFKNERPVTYHTISRQLGIHVNQAKIVLNEFYGKNKEKLSASYVITGSTDRGTLVKLSKSEDSLVNDITKFDSVHTIHIYAVTLNSIPFSTQEIAFEEMKYPVKYENAETLYKNGMIRGPELKEVKFVPPVSAPVSAKAAPKERATTPQTTAKPVRSSGLTSGYVSRKQQAAKPQNTISNYSSRKEEKAIPAKRSITESAPSGYQYKSRKTEVKAPRERVIVSAHDDEAEDVTPVAASTTKTDNAKLAQMFDDDEDFSDFGEDDEEEAEHKKELEIAASEIFVPENDDDEEIEEANSKGVSEEAEDAPAAQSSTKGEAEPKEDTVDEDGFLVTYRKPKTTQPPKASAAKPRAKTPTNQSKTSTKQDGKKKQSSLMNFFSSK